jgi:Trk K+ transport system NAD-binding subunit
VASIPILPDYRLVDVELTKPGPPIASRIADLTLPSHSLLVRLHRGNTDVALTDDTMLRRGDRLTFFVRNDQVDELAARIRPLRAPRS